MNALGTDRTVALYVVVGSGLGWLWYWLYPRPLADRLWFLAVLGVIATVMLLIGGTDVSRPSPSDAMALGVLIGLVLTETRLSWCSRWARQRHTALTSRATMRSLR